MTFPPHKLTFDIRKVSKIYQVQVCTQNDSPLIDHSMTTHFEARLQVNGANEIFVHLRDTLLWLTPKITHYWTQAMMW